MTLQSLEVGCSVVISAHEARVDVVAFPYMFPGEDPRSATLPLCSPIKPLLERNSSYFDRNRNGQSPNLGASLGNRP